MSVTHWKIYYDDNSIFSSEDGNPEDAPVDGIIQIIEWNGEGKRRILHNNDYYWWLGENWAQGDRADLHLYLRTLKNIKFGRWTKDSTYEQVSQLAWEDDE